MIYVKLIGKLQEAKPTMNSSYLQVLYVYPNRIVFLCAVELCCCPTTVENTSMSHMFLHPEEFGHVRLFRNGFKDSDHISVSRE